MKLLALLPLLVGLVALFRARDPVFGIAMAILFIMASIIILAVTS